VAPSLVSAPLASLAPLVSKNRFEARIIDSTADNLGEFFSRCLIAILMLTVSFADSVLLISIRFYCTILADSRHGRSLSFSKAAASNEMHPLKERLFDRLAFSLCVANRDRLAQVVNQILSRSKLTRFYFGMKPVLSRSRVTCYPEKLGWPSH
jgi:hypothetical protein